MCTFNLKIGLFTFIPLFFIPSLAQAQEPSTGKAIYEQNCAGCHGSDGSGRMRGVPDFTRFNGVLSKPESELVQNTINGVSGGGMFGMPAKGGNPNLSKQDIVNVIRYMKVTFRR
jgi:mono/diheme cytochrome c family protein